MSGEQAEERTAREGRLDHEVLRKKLEAIKPWSASLTVPGNTFTTYTISMCRCGLNKDVTDEQCGRCNQLELLSECSRLASRVEELEKGLRGSVDTMGFAHRIAFLLTNEIHELRMGAPKIHDRLKESIEAAEKLLAGAHAEEKPRNPNFCRCSHGKQAHEKHGFCDQLRCHCKRFESEG